MIACDPPVTHKKRLKMFLTQQAMLIHSLQPIPAAKKSSCYIIFHVLIVDLKFLFLWLHGRDGTIWNFCSISISIFFRIFFSISILISIVSLPKNQDQDQYQYQYLSGFQYQYQYQYLSKTIINIKIKINIPIYWYWYWKINIFKHNSSQSSWT